MLRLTIKTRHVLGSNRNGAALEWPSMLARLGQDLDPLLWNRIYMGYKLMTVSVNGDGNDNENTDITKSVLEIPMLDDTA